MGSSLEIIQDLTPLTVFTGTTSMALVDDDEIKEFRTELFISVIVFVIRKALVERKVDVVGGVNVPMLNNGHCFLKMAEVIAHRLVN